MSIRFAIAAIAASVMLLGCAATTIESTGSPLKEPLCQSGGKPVTAVVYWRPQWRPDQKEPALREAAALRGIQDFAGRTGCLTVDSIHRLPATDSIPDDAELLRMAPASTAVPERVVLVVLRELGPRLELGIPILLDGGTEVLIDVRVLDARTSQPLADTRTLWRNGGRFVIKGVQSLDRDMSAALGATLMRGAQAQ
jgi:hypothetical protein